MKDEERTQRCCVRLGYRSNYRLWAETRAERRVKLEVEARFDFAQDTLVVPLGAKNQTFVK